MVSHVFRLAASFSNTVNTGEDGLRCSSSAIQTRLGPSSLLEEWSEIPIVFVVSFVLSATPQTGGNGQGI